MYLPGDDLPPLDWNRFASSGVRRRCSAQGTWADVALCCGTQMTAGGGTETTLVRFPRGRLDIGS